MTTPNDTPNPVRFRLSGEVEVKTVEHAGEVCGRLYKRMVEKLVEQQRNPPLLPVTVPLSATDGTGEES